MKSWNPIWDEVFSSQEWGKYPSESLIRFIAKNYYKKDRAATRILEVGCGTGANLWYISREGFDTYGIDGSEVAIGLAAERFKKELLSVNLKCGDILELPYDNDYFDAVIDVECLYTNNKSNTLNILQEIRRVLKPGGKLYSRTFSDKMYLGKYYDEVGPLEYNNSSDGPFAGKGFARLSSLASINDIYGSVFQIESVDTLDQSYNGGSFMVSDYVVVGQKS